MFGRAQRTTSASAPAVVDAHMAVRRENSLPACKPINYPGGPAILHKQIASVGNTGCYFLQGENKG